MDEILFVCTGNTCRSPMAEAIFRAQGGEQTTGLHAGSAGIFTQDGLPASENACLAVQAFGGDLSQHRSRLLTHEIAANAKYILCMTGAHYDTVCAQYPDLQGRVFTLLPHDVPDPFGGDLETYRRAAEAIAQGVQQTIGKLSR